MSLRNPKWLLLFLLPVIYVIFSGIFLSWRPFYTIGPDPIYIYLSTGMNIASGNLKIFYIDNPGVPVQCFCAVVIYIKHLFNQGIPLYQDVLLHPESYLYVLCVAVAVIYFLVTFITGYYVFKRTQNLALSLLFQLTPFIGTGILSTGAPSPESFYIISGMFFMAYLYCNAVLQQEIKWRQILVYAIFTSFFVSCKYICFPLIFLVLFVLPNARFRIKYIGSFILFFLVWIGPALPESGKIMDWLFALATHTGHYGQGDTGFVKSSEFIVNLGKIFKEDKYFTIIYIVLIVSLLLAFIKQKQMGEKSKIYIRLLFGVGAASFVLILLVAKHYSFHYLISLQLCYPLIIAGSYGIFRDSVTLKIFKNKLFPRLLFYAFFIFLTFTQLKAYVTYPPRPTPHATADFLDKYKSVPIIMDVELGSSRIETSIYLGVVYTENFRFKYWEFLQKIYPNSYIYNEHQHAIGRWDDVEYTPELFSQSPIVLVYFKDKDSGTRMSILNNLIMWGKDTMVHAKLAYSLKETDEYVYELDGNQSLAKAMMSKYTEVNFDFEKLNLDKSKCISIGGKDTVTAGGLTDKEHHSGNNSVLMNEKNQYALNYIMRAYPGNLINASIWTKSDDGGGSIVFTSKTNGDFYALGHAVIDSAANGWKKIEYKCVVPPSIKDSAVFFYMFYYGHGYAYYDDLSVRVYPMKL